MTRTKTMSTDTTPTVTPKMRFPEFRNGKSWDTKLGSALFNQANNRDAPAGLTILAITQEYGAIPRSEIDYHVSVTDKSVETYKEVLPGDFIISLRSFQGGIEYSNHHGICSPAYVILRKKSDISDLFFKHLFKSHGFIQQLNKNLEGLRDGKMISYKQFSELLLPWPKQAEQRKIANFLSTLDELIDTQSQKLDALKAHKTGLMQQLFPREGETLPRLRFPDFKNAPAWRLQTLTDIAEIGSGTTPARANLENYLEGTIPWVKTGDLNNSFISRTEEHLTPLTKARVNPVGSVLVAMYGGFKQIGRTGCLSVPAATNQAISVLAIHKEIATSSFVLAWLNSKVSTWKRIASSSRKDPNITGSDVANFPICVPSIAEQERIASCVCSVDDLIAAESRSLEMLRAYKKGLLQQLFPSPVETRS